MRVAVVGAGIMGVSTALALAEGGHDVTLIEQFGAANKQGSSHGHSRIIRKAYTDPFYTAIMDEAYRLWHEIQAKCDKQIVFEPGLLYFGKFESESLRDVLAGLQQVGVPHEVLDPDQVRRVSPDLRLASGEIGIFTPEAGWVDPEGAVGALLQRFIEVGGLYRCGEAVDVERVSAEFDRYVLCPGAWITKFVELPVVVTLQTFAYVTPKTPHGLEGTVWIEDCPNLFYGFPSEPEKDSFKLGVHDLGPLLNPSSPNRTPSPDHMEAIKEQAAKRFGVKDATYDFRGCLYTTTGNEDFLLGRHGENGFFVSACSGHGFKFGPWMGRKLADFVEEKDAPECHPRFCWPVPLWEA